MIDKIELRLPPWVDFRPAVSRPLRTPGGIRSGLHYAGTLDLRPHGLDAMLHYRKRRPDHTHKLECFDTGEKTYSELCALMEGVMAYDISRLELTRIDLCADVPNVPVSWFHANARFRFKQLERRIGGLKADTICRTAIETVSAGRRPNIIRIYDKVAELKAQFRKSVRKQNRDADPLVFEEEYGFETDSILTRVERQYGGGRLPNEVRTFGQISNAAEIDPFENIEFLSNRPFEPRIENYDFGEWLKGMRLRDEAKARGMQNFRRWLNLRANGNAARMMKHYADFMPVNVGHTFDSAKLRAVYRESTIRQLAA